MEMYLHFVNYSIKDFGPGKSALDKKHTKSFGIATHIKVGSAFIFLSYGVEGVKMVSCCRSLQSFYFGYFDHALCCKPGASILAFIH